MLMLCYFYCIPAAKFLYFASGPILFLCAMFALKRGTRNQRAQLRSAAFVMMFCATLKLFIIDLFVITPVMQVDLKAAACGVYKLPMLECDADNMHAVRLVQCAGLLMFVIVMALLAHFYKVCMPARKQKDTTPAEVHLRFFANLAFISVLVMIAWQLAPWAGYLTVGCIPAIFSVITWSQLAMIDLALLVIGFWKLESCVWQFKVSEKERMRHLQNTWTPKDTLWMSVFLYILTIGMAYVSHDIMTRSHSVPRICGRGEASQSFDENSHIDESTDGRYNVQQ